jgi:hypothetical protein
VLTVNQLRKQAVREFSNALKDLDKAVKAGPLMPMEFQHKTRIINECITQIGQIDRVVAGYHAARNGDSPPSDQFPVTCPTEAAYAEQNALEQLTGERLPVSESDRYDRNQ